MFPGVGAGAEAFLLHLLPQVGGALGERAAQLRQGMADERLRHRAYTRQVGDDPADVREWVWPGSGPPPAAATDAQRGQPA